MISVKRNLPITHFKRESTVFTERCRFWGRTGDLLDGAGLKRRTAGSAVSPGSRTWTERAPSAASRTACTRSPAGPPGAQGSFPLPGAAELCHCRLAASCPRPRLVGGRTLCSSGLSQDTAWFPHVDAALLPSEGHCPTPWKPVL